MLIASSGLAQHAGCWFSGRCSDDRGRSHRRPRSLFGYERSGMIRSAAQLQEFKDTHAEIDSYYPTGPDVELLAPEARQSVFG